MTPYRARLVLSQKEPMWYGREWIRSKNPRPLLSGVRCPLLYPPTRTGCAIVLRLAWGELRLYLRTLLLVSLSPKKFAASWVAGSGAAGQAMNPLGFLATTVVIHGLAQQLVMRLMYGPDVDDGSPLWLTCVRQIGPYAYYALLGTLIHAALRLSGPTRRLRSSVAQALYVGAGPASLATLFTLGYFFALRLYVQAPFGEEILPKVHPALRIGALLLLVLTFFAFVIPLTKALGAVHQRRGVRLIGSVIAALVLAGLGSGYVRLQLGFQASLGSYLPELVLWLRRTEAGTLLPFATLWF